MSRIKHELTLLLSRSTHGVIPIKAMYSQLDTNSKHGDISFPCFAIARRFGMSTEEAFNSEFRFLNYERDLPFVKSVEFKAGFANFTLDRSLYLSETLRETDARLTKSTDKTETILLEYPSPNMNKELHVGHLRNLLLGHSLQNVLKFLGYQAEWTLYENNLGLGMCQAYIGMVEFKDQLEGVHEHKRTGTAYTLFHKHAEDRPELYDQAYALLEKMLEKDKWGHRYFPPDWVGLEISSDNGHEYVYSMFEPQRCGYNNSWSEKMAEPKGREFVLKMYEEGVLEKDEKGNIIANLEGYDLPNKVLLRANGTSVYATGDIGLALTVSEWKHPDRYVYITGNEQDLYFRQMFKVFDILGLSANREHISHGMVNLSSGKMKSRTGSVVSAEDVIEDACARSSSLELWVLVPLCMGC